MNKSAKWPLPPTGTAGFAGHFTLGLLIAGAAVTIPAHADSVTGVDVLEEVVVTAQRREESMQQTPIAVTAIDAEQLVQQNIRTLADVARLAPNLAISSSGYTTPSSALPILYIRGIGQQGPAIYTDPGVAIYIDGVYAANAVGGAIDLPDVARVEVLRGPQGTLFGKNAIGGAVSVITATPGQSPESRLEVTGGNYQTIRVRGFTNIAVTDTLGVTAAVDSKHEDGFGWRLAYPSGDRLGRLGDQNHLSGRVKVRWTPVDRLSVEVAAEGSRYRDTATPTQATVVPSNIGNLWNADVGAFTIGGTPHVTTYSQDKTSSGRYDNYAEQAQPVADDIGGYRATVEYDLGWSKVRSITAYRHAHDSFVRDSDSSPIFYVNDVREMRSTQKTEEAQLFGDFFGARVNYMFGAFYMQDQSGQHDSFYTNPGLFAALTALGINANTVGGSNVSRDTQALQITNSRAIYLQAGAHFTDKLSLTAGVRYTSENKKITLTERSLETQIVNIPGLTELGHWPAVTPSAALKYQFDADTLAYVSATRGFKSGGFNGNAGNLSQFLNANFLPETVWSREIGVKSEFFDHRMRANLAVYRSTYKNIQLNLIQNGVNTVFNVEGARIQGYEGEVTVIPLSGLELSGSIGCTDDKYTKIQSAVTIVHYNHKIPYTPRMTESLSARYIIGMGERGTVTPSLAYFYRTSAYTSPNNTPASYMQGYGLLSGRLTYAPVRSPWDLTLYGTNLANKRYVVSAGDITGSGAIVHLYGAPVEYGATFNMHF